MTEFAIHRRGARAMWAWSAAAVCLLLINGHTWAGDPQQVTDRQREERVTDGQHAGRVEFLVVTPREFVPELKTYIEARRQEMVTELAVLEDVLHATAGVDDPEKLKRYLYEQWRTRKLRYVLLVGDADVMPVRYMVLDRITPEAFDYAFYPSDLYYADVAKADGSFEDWNARRDGFHAGYFGEVRGEKNKQDPINFDQIDYRPELAVGRWPVSSREEVRIVADKSMRHGKTGAADNGPPPRAGLVAVGGWIENRPLMDALGAQLPTGWTAEKRYFADAGRDDHTPPPNEEEVIKLLNSGVTLVMHSGHGRDDGWDQSLSVASLKRVTNAEQLPVVLSAGCSTARFATLPPYEAYLDVNGKDHKGTNAGEVFDRPPPPPAPYQKGAYNGTGLGEQMLRAGPNGAAVYIGCNTGGQPCAMTLLAGFMEALHKDGTARVGDCWAGAIAYYFEKEGLANLKPNADWYPPSIFFQGMKYMLFGDPTLRVDAARR